jgi:hypothetical protein
MEEERIKRLLKNRLKSCFQAANILAMKKLNWRITYNKGFASLKISEWSKVKPDIMAK